MTTHNPSTMPFPVEEIAKAVAAQIAARGAGTPVVRVREPLRRAEAPGLPGAISGEVTIEIAYNTTTYELTFHAPTTADPYWLFRLSMTSGTTEEELAVFKFKDGDNWKVGITYPFTTAITSTLSIGPVSGNLQNGTIEPA
jgi:hypothetical protein